MPFFFNIVMVIPFSIRLIPNSAGKSVMSTVIDFNECLFLHLMKDTLAQLN